MCISKMIGDGGECRRRCIRRWRRHETAGGKRRENGGRSCGVGVSGDGVNGGDGLWLDARRRKKAKIWAIRTTYKQRHFFLLAATRQTHLTSLRGGLVNVFRTVIAAGDKRWRWLWWRWWCWW